MTLPSPSADLVGAPQARRAAQCEAKAEAKAEAHAQISRLLGWLPEAGLVICRNRICHANAAAQRLFGVAEADLVGHSPQDFFHPDSIELARSRWQALRAGVAALPVIEEKILCADGQTRRVETTAALVDGPAEMTVLVMLHDITALTRTQAELVQANAELQRLGRARNDSEEGDRKRLAGELHDELQQSLAAIRIELAAIRERMADDPAAAVALVPYVDGLVRGAMVSARRIVNDLRPPILEDLGLVPAVEMLLGQFSQRTGIATEFEAEGGMDEGAAPWPRAATCLYRVAQEALKNVAAHAQAHRVSVFVAIEAGGPFVLRIRDDGRGMQADDGDKPESFGLRAMRERLGALNGSLHITSDAGIGTTLEAIVSRPGAAHLPMPTPMPTLTRARQASTPTESSDAYSMLLRFLYRAPVGLVQAGIDGRIELLNPMAAQLLMPLSPDGLLDNLFTALAQVAPRLPRQVADFARPSGEVCDALRIPIPLEPGRRGPSLLSLSLMKKDGVSLMAVINDITPPH